MTRPQRWLVAVKHGIDVNLTRADPGSGRIDLAHAPRKTSDFDRNGVEEAVRLREKFGGTVTAVTVGPPPSREAIRDALSLGADEGILLSVPEGIVLDSSAVAAALAAFFRTPAGSFDVAFFGEGSTDHFSGTVGARVAAELRLPSLSHVRRVTVENELLQVERDVEAGIETLESSFPAVVTVGQEINTPRLPTFMSTLKASKKQIREITVESLGISPASWGRSVTILDASLPSMPRKRIRVSGGDPGAVSQELVRILQREGFGRR